MAEKAASKERKRTRYSVFRVTPDGLWQPVHVVDAYGGIAAIVAVAPSPGDYRAVPVSNITDQAMGYPPPQEPTLVPVAEPPTPADQIQDALDAADPPHSAAGGSLRAVDPPDTVTSGQEALS